MIDFRDDELLEFAANGPSPLPQTPHQGYVENDHARIWYAAFGLGEPVILLHGGLGNSGNWGYQVPALVEHGYKAIVIDTRGHGRSTRDARPFSYDQMAFDVLAVMDALSIVKASFVGWSDGAVIALSLAKDFPNRVSCVFFFACNVDSSGTKEFVFTPVIGRCLDRHRKDYVALSVTTEDFDSFSEAVGIMQATQPNYSANDLSQIKVPVTSVLGEHDEFIKLEHAKYLAQTIPAAQFVQLKDVSHFAPVQRPMDFNKAILDFLDRSKDGSR